MGTEARCTELINEIPAETEGELLENQVSVAAEPVTTHSFPSPRPPFPPFLLSPSPLCSQGAVDQGLLFPQERTVGGVFYALHMLHPPPSL